tara:strand:+ start:1268 stop:2911 length:1644 start_codon:yes stop_codon:yes gene_type:complete
MPENIESYKVICSGGLHSSENHLDLAENSPGVATRLVNYEPSLYGGYRRVNGYEVYDSLFPEVGYGVAEGRILGVILYRNEGIGNPYIIAARKDIGAATYSLYKKQALIDWTPLVTGLSLATTIGSRSVLKLRSVQFDFGAGTTGLLIVDGVNPATYFDGTTWTSIIPANSGGNASAGGPMALGAPSLVAVYENHIVMSGDSTAPSVVANSAPRDPLTWTAAAGAAQTIVGFPVVQIKPFRENLFVFGSNDIKKIYVDTTNLVFAIENVTTNVGCVAADSVLEIGGDLMFLAHDGLRPVAGTSRIGDVELETISKPVQATLVNMIANYDMSTLNGVVVRGKSQVRFFVGDDATATDGSYGILGGLSDSANGISWGHSELLGIRASCCTSGFIGADELVLHGDYDGRVYRQERGTSYAGEDIIAVYSMPYLDLGDTEVRKTIRKVHTFIRAEGPLTMNLSVAYDWGDYNTARPSAYTQGSTGAPTIYGGRGITYNGTNVVYGGTSKPIMTSDIQGSGFSVRVTYVSVGQDAPFTIQGVVFEYSTAGRR